MTTDNSNQQEEKKVEETNEPEIGGEAKGEKKVKKALLKLGLTKIDNVNRVTIKQKDNYFFIVKEPEVYVSKESESSYIIFGELSMDDPDKPKGKEEFNNLKAQGETLNTLSQPKGNVEVVDDETEVSEEGIDKELIDMVIAETKVSRQKAVKALRNNNLDVVNSILELNN